MPPQVAEVADSIARYVRAVIECNDEYAAAERAEIARLEAEGYRLVSGGQALGDETGELVWQVTDYRTGEVLASGTTEKEYKAASEALEAQQPGYHIDHLLEDSQAQENWLAGPDVPAGIPAPLAEALAEWASDNEDGARAWLAQLETS
jgi:hypothetical protein